MADDMIKRFKQTLESGIQQVKDARFDDERRRLMSTIGQDLAQMLAPFLMEIANSAKQNKDSLREVMSELKGEVASRDFASIDTAPIIDAIERAFGGIYLPEPKVTVNVPDFNVDKLAGLMKFPEEMQVTGWVRLMGVDMNNPLPVQLRDFKGNPINLFENLTQIVGGGGGGVHNVKVSGLINSAFADYINSDNRLRVSVETGGSGLTDSELRAAHLDVQQVSGSADSTNVIQFGGDAVAKGAEVNAGYLRVVLAQDVAYSTFITGANGTIASAMVDSTGVQYSGSNPVPVTLVSGGTSTSASALVDSTGVQYSGSNPLPISGTVVASSITASVAASVVDSTGVAYTGSNPLPITGTVVASSITASVATNIVDSGGVAYTTTNPLPIGDAGGSLTIDGSVSVSGSITSTVVTGSTVSDAVDDNSAPVKIGAIARTANPSAVSGGDSVSLSADDVGRPITRPIQARDLIQTAYATLTNGTETTLLAASAGSYHDLIYVMGANNSDVAVTVDIRPVTAGNVVMTLQIPASGTAGVALPVPIPQSDTGNNWTADMGDITGTTVYVSALFTREV